MIEGGAVYLTGAGGAVVVAKGGSVFVDVTVEQAASQRKIEHFPLACGTNTQPPHC